MTTVTDQAVPSVPDMHWSKTAITLLFVGLWALVAQLIATPDACAANCQISSESLSLTFNSAGGIERITVHPGGDLVAARGDLPIFTLITHDAKGAEVKVPLSDVENEGSDGLVARSADQLKEVHFVVSRGARHLALRIASLQNISGGSFADSIRLSFNNMTGTQKLHAIELDWLEDLRSGSDWFECSWNHLDREVSPTNLGGVAFYTSKDDDDEDEALAHVWGEAQVAHPKTGKDWNFQAVRKWMAEWQHDFADRSQMILEGKNLAELRAALPMAQRMQAKEIYLFTQTWRTDSFWPTSHGHVQINRAVFPRGEEDLRAFSDELKQKGMFLKLHYVSGGIGKDDENYIGKKPDRRLAAWVHGTLSTATTADQTDMLFVPADAERGVLGDGPNLGRPRGLAPYMMIGDMRVGDELIEVGGFARDPSGAWKLSAVHRGVHGTVAVAHEAGEDSVGLISPYGQVYVPDNDSPLLAQMAHEYAQLLENCHIANAEYDGAEIHCYDGDWGYHKYATLVYQELTHPVTGHDSSGRAPPCHFEYRFNSTKRLMKGACAFTHGGWNAPVELDTPSREASRLLDANYLLSQGHWGGAQGISKPEPMFSVSVPMLSRFGLSDAMFQTIADWKNASRLMSPEQHQQIDASFAVTTSHMPEHSQHPVSPVVQVAHKIANGYAVTPVRVLIRSTGDIPWQQGQEHGPVSPRQYLKVDQRIELHNPERTQTPHVILRMMWAFAPDGAEAATDGGTAATGGERPPSEAFTAGNLPAETTTAARPNLLIRPPKTALDQAAASHLTQSGESWSVASENTGDADYWECKYLPSWGCSMDMIGRRGIGLEIEGDGKGALLLIQITGRDYAVPIDFVGKRWIEVPNGEVAWSQGCWGWRMDTKSCDYHHITSVGIGFGYVPAHTSTKVTFARLQALAEIPVTLIDPVLHLGGCSLRFKGKLSSGEYVDYQGGAEATVYDANWNKLRSLPLSAPAGRIASGTLMAWMEAGAIPLKPWFEMQVMAQGDSMIIPGK